MALVYHTRYTNTQLTLSHHTALINIHTLHIKFIKKEILFTCELKQSAEILTAYLFKGCSRELVTYNTTRAPVTQLSS